MYQGPPINGIWNQVCSIRHYDTFFLSLPCPRIAFPAFVCGKHPPDKPPIILQPNKVEDNDVHVTIVCAVSISRVVMAMSLVSMLNCQQELLFSLCAGVDDGGVPPRCVCDDTNNGFLDARGNNDGAAGDPMDTPARRSLPSPLPLRLVPGTGLRVGTICR
jgi:hypothetical protein